MEIEQMEIEQMEIEQMEIEQMEIEQMETTNPPWRPLLGETERRRRTIIHTYPGNLPTNPCRGGGGGKEKH